MVYLDERGITRLVRGSRRELYRDVKRILKADDMDELLARLLPYIQDSRLRDMLLDVVEGWMVLRWLWSPEGPLPNIKMMAFRAVVESGYRPVSEAELESLIGESYSGGVDEWEDYDTHSRGKRREDEDLEDWP